MMKRKLLLLICCMVLLGTMMCSGAFAAETERIFDEAGILSDSDIDELQNRIEKFRSENGIDVVIWTVNQENLPYDMLMTYTDDWYDDGILTKGFGEDGLLVFLNMCDDEDGRDYWINGCERGADLFDTYFFECVEDKSKFVSNLKSGDYSDAFLEVIELADKFAKQAETGEPYSESNPYKEKMGVLAAIIAAVIEFFVSLGIGSGYAGSLASKMNNAVAKQDAREYIVMDKSNIENLGETFLYSNVTRTKIVTNTGTRSGGGGSSIHISSGGHSHSGGGGHF